MTLDPARVFATLDRHAVDYVTIGAFAVIAHGYVRATADVDLVTTATAADVDVVLHVVMIPLELSSQRVAARVAAGGHDVPTTKLTGRYHRLWSLVAAALPHCHRTVFWNNAGDEGPFEVASYRHATADYPPRWPAWTPRSLLDR